MFQRVADIYIIIYTLLLCINKYLYIFDTTMIQTNKTMTKRKIDNNVDIPVFSPKYPFLELRVGQSFVAGKYSMDLQRNLISLGAYYQKKTGFEFKARIDADRNLRVWRTA